MRMRTIDKGFEEIISKDPGTNLSKTAWRRLITSGEIPSVCIGTKRLVNMDIAEQYLTTGEPERTTPLPIQGTIRRIEAK